MLRIYKCEGDRLGETVWGRPPIYTIRSVSDARIMVSKEASYEFWCKLTLALVTHS